MKCLCLDFLVVKQGNAIIITRKMGSMASHGNGMTMTLNNCSITQSVFVEDTGNICGPISKEIVWKYSLTRRFSSYEFIFLSFYHLTSREHHVNWDIIDSFCDWIVCILWVCAIDDTSLAVVFCSTFYIDNNLLRLIFNILFSLCTTETISSSFDSQRISQTLSTSKTENRWTWFFF